MMFRQKNRQKPSTGRMLNQMEEEKKEVMGAGNLPDFWSGTSELDMLMVTCEADVILISQWFTLKMIIFWGFVLTQQCELKSTFRTHIHACHCLFHSI